MGRIIVGLLVIDALVVATFGLIDRPEGPAKPEPPVAPVKPDGGARPIPKAVLWNGVDPAGLGKRVGALYLGIRRQIGKNRKVVLSPPRRSGDDVEIRVALANSVGYPASMYCFHCETQRCLFSDGATAGFGALAAALPVEDVRDLVKAVGKEHVQVRYVGSASGGAVVTKSEAQTCEDGKPTTVLRFPMDYDTYDESECGAHECEVAGSGEKIRLESGRIDDNKKLACLRAVCLKQGDMGDLPVKYVGEVAFEQGMAYRGGEVMLVLRGIGADGAAYPAFWEALTVALGEKP